MGGTRVLSREDLAALVSEHRGDLDAAAAAIGTTRSALHRRVLRAGLTMRLPRWGPGASPAATAAGSSPAYALAALELAVENEGLKAALVGAEGVIDHLTGKVAALAEEMAELLRATTMKAYSYEELGGLKNQILEVCERVKDENPTAWREAHNGNFDDTSTRYNDLCVQALRAAGIFAGCNGKRGGDQRSDDVLDFGLTDGRGARDTSGRFQSIAIIDYIAGAGGPNPSVGWNDVSQAAPGKFLDPQGLPRVDGGPTKPPPEPPPGNGEPHVPPPPPPQNVDLTPVLAELKAIHGAIDALSDALFKQDRDSPSMLEHMDDVKRIVLNLPRNERFR